MASAMALPSMIRPRWSSIMPLSPDSSLFSSFPWWSLDIAVDREVVDDAAVAEAKAVADGRIARGGDGGGRDE